MMTKFGVVAIIGLLGGCLSLQANNSLILTGSAGQNALTHTTFSGPDGDISPYTGTLTQAGVALTGVQLFCDDANNSANSGYTTGWNVNIAQVGSSQDTGTVASGDTARFGDVNGAPSTSGKLNGTSIPVPTGTTLYEEEAWLFTQMIANPSSTSILTSAQEAAWELTGDTDQLSGDSSNVATWMQAAYNAVTNGNTSGSGGIGSVTDASLGVSSISAATYADWFIFTDSTGCGGGTCADNTTSTGEQEFLAYFASGTTTTHSTGTPEPATFWLFGSALLFGAFFARRKTAAVKVQ